MNAMIAVLGGVLGGICLFFFGWMMILIVVPILMWAHENKQGNPTPLDHDNTFDWERECEEEKEEERWRI